MSTTLTQHQRAVLRRLEPALVERGIPFSYGHHRHDLPIGTYGWTGEELWMDAGTFWFDAYHEFAHWLIAPLDTRPHPTFDDNDETEPDASALGIYLHAVVGLDLEGAVQHAAAHDWGRDEDDALEGVVRHLNLMAIGSEFYRNILLSFGWNG